MITSGRHGDSAMFKRLSDGRTSSGEKSSCLSDGLPACLSAGVRGADH